MKDSKEIVAVIGDGKTWYGCKRKGKGVKNDRHTINSQFFKKNESFSLYV
jgi:hypothetical protein